MDNILYGTSKKFLEVFRLKSLNDLPSPESLELSELSDILNSVDDEFDKNEEELFEE